jgi:TonB family protein
MSQQEGSHGLVVRRIIGVNYPRLANLAGIQGSVELTAKVAASGNVESIRTNSGHELLVDSAKQALQGWKFRCATPGSSCEANVTFKFVLLNEICDQSACSTDFAVDLPNIVTVRTKRLHAMVD